MRWGVGEAARSSAVSAGIGSRPDRLTLLAYCVPFGRGRRIDVAIIADYPRTAGNVWTASVKGCRPVLEAGYFMTGSWLASSK